MYYRRTYTVLSTHPHVVPTVAPAPPSTGGHGAAVARKTRLTAFWFSRRRRRRFDIRPARLDDDVEKPMKKKKQKNKNSTLYYYDIY